MNADERFGTSKATEIKKIVVDYGGANVAKPLHIGHLDQQLLVKVLRELLNF